MSGRGGVVAFPVPPEVAFDYLVDPAHRAEWQSSLRRVEDVDGGVGDGQSWTDVTKPGLRPRMRTTTFRRPHEWSEVGEWRGLVTAVMTLRFEATASGCDVHFRFGLKMLGPVGRLATLVSVPPVRADLRRAATALGRRAGRDQ